MTAIRALAVVMFLIVSPITALANQVATPAAPRATPVAEPGSPRFPDLVALPPDALYLSTEILADGAPHHLLRFTSAVGNIGEGPLELSGTPQPGGEVVQLVHDGTMGGTVAERHHLGTDLVYHPEHHHFHLDRFATFELLRKEPDGVMIPVGEGGKQSSCLLDTLPLSDEVPPVRTYEECESERQGISVGWKDIYSASLPHQWVDLGREPLADGTYVLRYTVDPLRQIEEDGRTGNNVGETRFSVRNGEIAGRPDPPRCAIVGDTSGPAGADITVRCSHFPSNTLIKLYWDGWDPWDASDEPIATVSSRDGEARSVTFRAVDAPPGSYTITAVTYDDAAQRHVSATVIYGVEPGAMATPA